MAVAVAVAEAEAAVVVGRIGECAAANTHRTGVASTTRRALVARRVVAAIAARPMRPWRPAASQMSLGFAPATSAGADRSSTWAARTTCPQADAHADPRFGTRHSTPAPDVEATRRGHTQ